jgi:hypothetical protein
MTMSPGDPGPTDPAEGSAVPPYEGRRETADVDGEENLHRDGANVGAATGPVESEAMKAPDPADTPRGAVASPADEQPAADSGGPDPGEASVGPAHHGGTSRGEDVSRDTHGQGGPEQAAGTGDS